jgi:acetoacetyl-CoA synthetase
VTNKIDSAATEGDILWCPSDVRKNNSNLTQYNQWLRRELGKSFSDYQSLHAWSVSEPDAFWRSIWTYFRISGEAEFATVLQSGNGMFEARWFEGARLNYAEHLLRMEADDPHAPAICHGSETTAPATISRGDLGTLVRKLATELRAIGVGPGDRVVSCMPNVPECAIAMMATVAIGAVWAAAAPECGEQTIVDRFAQVSPKVLFAADGYRFGGKAFDRREVVTSAAARLPSLSTIIWLPILDLDLPSNSPVPLVEYSTLLAGPDVAPGEFRYERVPSNHPLWILFSSGTTGIPKAIAHSHPGVLAEHFKCMALQLDTRESSRVFVYTSPGWMMWNIALSSLLVGACAVLYDGSPACDGPLSLWSFAAATRCTLFGISPGFIRTTSSKGIVPGKSFNLSAIDTVLLGGAPSGPEIYDWVYRSVKDDMWVFAPSGGTEIVSAFVTGNVTAPVRAGEIQALALGMDVQVWNEQGQQIFDQTGELVVAAPFPSAPLFFWGDEDGTRYRESYFEYFPGVWRHGDLAKMRRNGGTYIYGRSDSTLNRFGVRIGTAEIYAIMERIGEVRDSLVVCCENPGGAWFMPLFVVLADDAPLTDELRSKIIDRLRHEGSPRHVPDEILAVPTIPYTLTGKKMEVPVRKLLSGLPAQDIFSRDALADASSFDWFINFARNRAANAQEY